MLDKQVFKQYFDLLFEAFPTWGVDKSSGSTMSFWYSRFKTFDNERFSHMVESYIEHEKFNPTVAGLKEHDTLPRKSITQINHEKMLKENGLI